MVAEPAKNRSEAAHRGDQAPTAGVRSLPQALRGPHRGTVFRGAPEPLAISPPSVSVLRGSILQAESWPSPSEIAVPSAGSLQKSLSGSATPDSKPRGILRVPSGRSLVNPSPKSAGIYLDSSVSSSSDSLSAKSLKSSQKRASEQASGIQAQMQELQKLNRTLQPQISHFLKMVDSTNSFSDKQRALQEVRARRAQFVVRQR